jgi:hypothetical protein
MKFLATQNKIIERNVSYISKTSLINYQMFDLLTNIYLLIGANWPSGLKIKS